MDFSTLTTLVLILFWMWLLLGGVWTHHALNKLREEQ